MPQATAIRSAILMVGSQAPRNILSKCDREIPALVDRLDFVFPVSSNHASNAWRKLSELDTAFFFGFFFAMSEVYEI